MTTQAAVFLDRDGVINETVFRRGAQRAPQDMDEWRWVQGLHGTLTALRARGYLLVVVTNQPDVSRGWQRREQVDAFHAMIMRELPVARVYACFHDRDHDCACRKPRPGMLLQASAALGIALGASYMVGDRDSDVAAGQQAGCRTVHFHRDAGQAPALGADHTITRLAELLAIAR